MRPDVQVGRRVEPRGEAREPAPRAQDGVPAGIAREGAQALDQADQGKILAYCRSGTRSTLLWALTRARAGDHPDVLAAQAAAAGYDISPVRQIMDALKPQ